MTENHDKQTITRIAPESTEIIYMTRGQWYIKRLREWLKGVWIWKNVP